MCLMIWVVSRSFLTERVKCQVLKPPVIQQQESQRRVVPSTLLTAKREVALITFSIFPKKALLSPEPVWNLRRAPRAPGAQLGDCLCLPPHIEAQIQEQLLTIKLIILCRQRLRGCSQVLRAAARLALAPSLPRASLGPAPHQCFSQRL